MSLVYKGDVVLVNCTDPAGQQGARGIVDSTHYGQNGSRYHVGVRPEAAPDEIHWHETTCLEVIRRAGDVEPEPTSHDLDTREPPTCECGAAVYRDGRCVRCDEAAFEARNRAQAPGEQRD